MTRGKGSVGRSGRVILTAIAPGRHRAAGGRSGEKDDEARSDEIRPDGAEQIIQAQLKTDPSSSAQLTPRMAAVSTFRHAGGYQSVPGVVVCTRCQSRFAAGAGSAVVAAIHTSHHSWKLYRRRRRPLIHNPRTSSALVATAAMPGLRSSVANAASRLTSGRLIGRRRSR